ncbi:uncharacterized protein LOC131804637 [Musca domestica]|uniref:Uncharacterized protein LOC131804637 n=1 Tax=Musca domestica TaxID=7370 RepID=A0ABM3VCZ1_MUSDO|nr:uncharacterized protein LOC131804637 [Musca domestica]
MSETIRPGKIFEAARYLIETELYRKHEICISSEWLANMGPADQVPFIANSEDRSLLSSVIDFNLDEDHIEEHNPQETLLDYIPVENVQIQNIEIAPGEGHRPMDLLLDEDSEELSFPTIYCGIKRKSTATIAKLIKSEARRYDRRCARVDKVLYSYKKLEFSKIKNSISTCLRKKIGTRNYTATDALNDRFIQNIVQHDEGYHILKGVRSSPAHWEAEKKKVLAMIRQFGIPTFFITLSAAESQWPELIVILVKIAEGRNITEEEAMSFSTQKRYELIRSDPITCSRYFDHRIRHLFKSFTVNGGIFDEFNVIKFYWRIEFQQRGSPHVHGIYWLNNAPLFDISDRNSFQRVTDFVDKFVSTDSSNSEIQDIVHYQQHNHGRACQREIRGQKFCRFHIPYPPMSNTELLLPFSDDVDEQQLSAHKCNYDKIYNLLNAKLTDIECERLNNFDQFLADPRINMDKDEYLAAIRSSLRKPKIFLKRSFKDRSINAFNSRILKMHKANMDIQFVLDAYACVSYIVNYINKSNRGVSRLLQETMNEIREGNYSVKQKLQHIGNKFISASEVSAQEAAYNILGMHLSQCSSSDVYVNTLLPEKRVRILKPRQELQNLSPDSTDIYVSNLLEHYIQRPDNLGDVCLAYFAAHYTYSKTLRKRNRQHDEEDEDILEDDEEHPDDVGALFRLKNNSGYVYKRRSPAIIRFPSFRADLNRDDYFRTLVMLYFPWRNEDEDIIGRNNEDTCSIYMDVIERNRQQFEMFKDGELHDILQSIREDSDGGEDHASNDNITSDQLLDEEFRALVVPELEENINVFDIDNHHEDDLESEANVHLFRKFDFMSMLREELA